MAEPRRVALTEMGVWGKAVRVELGGQFEEVWVQTVGDRSEAVERGHEAMQRKLLEFRAGGERDLALREALAISPSEDLIEMVLDGERSRLAARLRRELPDPVRPRRDTAAGETADHFGRRMHEYEEQGRQRAAERDRRLAQALASRRAELVGKPKAELVELARPRRVDVECWNAFARACDDWVLLRAVRRAEDHGQQYFPHIAQVHGLHAEVKEQLRAAYRELEPTEAEAFPKSSAGARTSGSTT
jgi:hypothetical protein